MLPARSVLAGKKIDRIIGSHFRCDNSVLEVGELSPVSGCIHQVVSELPAVSVGHGNDQPAAVLAGMELNLGNAGKILADDILFCIRAKVVKVHGW